MTEAPDILIFTPVGTSLLTNKEVKPQRQTEEANKRSVAQIVRGMSNNYLINAFDPGATDDNPAEISSLYAFSQKWGDALAVKKIRILLLHSPGVGEACAAAVANLIGNDKYFPKPAGSVWEAQLLLLAKLDPQNQTDFPQALQELAQVLKAKTQDFSGEVYLNITGGYKALAPYLTMMGLALGRQVQIFYLFAEAKEVIVLPPYPLAFDLLEWRDWRGLLLPFTRDLGLSAERREELYRALGRSKLHSLIQDKPPYALNPVGELLHNLYDRQRGLGLSEFGTGSLLLEQCGDFADYLARHCIPRWRHLSTGDHIPETVEHGRGHVQRLLELTQQLLLAADIKLSPEETFILVSSIWLHDLGHSGDCFYFEGNDGLFQDKDHPASTETWPVYGEPNKVRKYHNFLTYELLKPEWLPSSGGQSFLFPDPDDFLKAKRTCLIKSIALVCLYHRKAMPVQTESGGTKVDQCRVIRGLGSFGAGDRVMERLPLLTSLLRFLDGAENQEERTVSEGYYQVMDWVLRRRVSFLQSLPDYRDGESRVAKEAKFKDKQIEHFHKHRMISNVFLVRESKRGLNPNGIYGRGDYKPLVGAYLIAAPPERYDEGKVFKEIINGFLEEFLLVQEYLPFRLTIFLLKEEAAGFRKKHCVITHAENVKSEKWPYKLEEIK